MDKRKDKAVPFDCPTCELLLRDKQDVFAYLEYECCFDCKEEIAYPNKEKWKNGWRPSKKSLILIRKKRASIPSYMKIY